MPFMGASDQAILPRPRGADYTRAQKGGLLPSMRDHSTLPWLRSLPAAVHSVVTVLMAMTASLAWARAAGAQPVNETALHSFAAGFDDGASCYSGLVEGADGVFYGTTWGGGAHGAGTIFKVCADGTGYTVLRSFTNAPDGETPFSALIQGVDGALYGTTYYGGGTNAGTVFKIATNGGNYEVLYSFTNGAGGAHPYGGLVQRRDGILYGTTLWGGEMNAGTVFKLCPDGTGYSVLHSFTNSPDGALPRAGLTQGTDGALYGTTSAGGDYLAGTVFRLQNNGDGYSVLRSFGYLPDGASPQAGLTQASDGRLYGTTVIGGANGFGTVFGVDTNGNGYQTLHSFTNSPDGANPYASLAEGSDGALYGTTTWGGNTNGGTVFKLSLDGGVYSVLCNFAWHPGDGSHPFAGVVEKAGGVFYGTTMQGGADGFGTVYRLAFLPTLGISFSQHGVQITLTGFSDQSCHLQTSTNLTAWDTVADFLLTNGATQLLDTTPALSAQRFYRVLVR
jgi:uncharacterized repeat protein (TIGR03803 family)